MAKAFERYAAYYDLLYSDKDYEGEIDFLEEIFQEFGGSPIKKVLDFTCGTGRHALELSRRGLTVSGSDISKSMIEIASKKAERAKQDIEFTVAPVQQLDLPQKDFDAAIAMFESIDYLTSDRILLEALDRVRAHLKRGGLLIFDFRNPEFLKKSFYPQRHKVVERDGLTLIRHFDASLDNAKQMLDIRMRVWVLEGNTLKDSFTEKHQTRLYSPEDWPSFMESTGFKLLKIGPFSQLEDPLELSPTLCVVAKAR